MDDDTDGTGEQEDQDDLSDALVARGVNRVTANHLADQHADMAAVEAAVDAAGDVTDLHGVGEASAFEVRQSFGVEQDADSDDMSDESGGGSDAEESQSDSSPSAEEKAVQAAREADPDDDLPGPALSVLKQQWSRYKRGLGEGREAAEEVEQYREARAEAEEAAAIINDVRDAYGQEPIDFDGVEGIPEVEELGGPITSGDPGVSLSFSWSADPYDPTEDL